MRDAAVGFQCPECVAEGNRGIRQAKSTFGGALVRAPYVTWTLLGANVLVFLAQYLVPDIARLFGMNSIMVALGDEYYRLITAAFVHVSLFHILFNCWALYVIGPYLERAFGHVRFAALYFVSAFGGSVLGLWMDHPRVFTIGASGAIFGLFGAVFVVGRRLNLDVRGITVLIVINLAITFIVPGISWTGHIGGLVTGAALSAALAYAPKENRTRWQLMAVAGFVVLLAVLVVVRVPMITFADLG